MNSQSKNRYISGFSLIELLIVIALGALVTSLVAPQAVSLVGRYSTRMDQFQLQDLVRRTSYEAFIRQEFCSLIAQKLEVGGVAVKIICANETVTEEFFEVEADTLPADPVLKGLPKSFNGKGLPVYVVTSDEQ